MALLEGSEGRGKFAAGPNGDGGWGILDAGHHVITGMLLTTGSGKPEQGETFARSALRFRGAEQTVTSARPTDNWTGAAARAYADANTRQADRAASMAVLDGGVHTVIAREADQVSHRRENLDGQATYLADLGSAAGSMALVPGVGQALRSAIELTAVNAALATSSSELRELAREADANTTALREIAGEYATLTLNPPTPDGAQAASIDGAALTSEAAPEQPAEATTTAIASAVGVLGGVISAVVAPLAAVVSGVAGAAGQSIGLLGSAAGPSDGNESAPATVDDINTAVPFAEPERRDDDAPSAGRPAESAAQSREQPDKLGPERSPAATRPPQ